VLDRLDKIDQQFERLDKIEQRLDGRDQKNAAEFLALRREMAEGFSKMEQRTEAEFNAIRKETTEGFSRIERHTTAEFKSVRNDLHQIYTHLKNKIEAQGDEFRASHSRILTGMDHRAGEYQKFDGESAAIFANQSDMKRDIEKLKEKDVELEKRIADLEAAPEQP
jgi:hypothetical protein